MTITTPGETLTKESAKKLLRRDYIPNGRKFSTEDLESLSFQKTQPWEVYQCGRVIGDDPQSGPLYCGEIAEYIAQTSDGVLVLCKNHPPPHSL